MAHAQLNTWTVPSGDLALFADQVHVWRVPLAAAHAQTEMLFRTLDANERARAATFRFNRHRDEFVTTRGTLRMLAAAYLGLRANSISFGYATKGKPYIQFPRADLRFNVSHSGEFALLAFGRGREVGIDIERRQPLEDLLAVASITFSARECSALRNLSPDLWLEAFFSCWSRKEAFLKATGEGLSYLADFDVSLHPDEPALLRAAGPFRRERWSFHAMPAIVNHASALVVEGHDAQIEHFECRCFSSAS